MGCSTSYGQNYVIQRRGPLEQNQTLVSDTGGDIFISKCSIETLDQVLEHLIRNTDSYFLQ